MGYQIYRILHVVGIMLLFGGLIGMLTIRMTSSDAAAARRARLLAAVTHGIGMVLMLVTGFGMLARLGYGTDLPGWAWVKAGVWLALGLSISLAKRRGMIGWPLVALFVALGALAAYMAILKPF